MTKTVTYNSGRGTNIVTDYVKGIEYVNHVMSSIYHDEGRLVNVNGTWESEYAIKDHLGNTRVTFRDVDGNGVITATDITQEANYYPFGMQMEGDWSPAAAVRIPYLYNGIEHVSDLGLDINTALFRTLDPALGRWWQIDPKAEEFYAMSPYNSMGNNPVSSIDPNGDFVMETVLACAAIGAVVNTAIQGIGGKINSQRDFFQAFGMGALNGAMIGMGAPSMAVGAAKTVLNSLSSLLPSFSVGDGSFQLSISPSLMYGSNGFSLGANINMGIQIGDGYVGFGVGLSGYTNNYSTSGTPSSGFETRSSFLSGIMGNDGSFLLGSNSFNSGETSQQTGIMRASLCGFHVGYENDGTPFQYLNLGDGGDSYRTAAASIGYKDISIGFNLVTGRRDYEANRDDYVSKNYSMFGKNWWNHRWVNNSEINDYRLGALYMGYKGYNIGWNSDDIRHAIQNKFAHTAAQPQPWIPRMNAPNTGLFMQYRSGNPFTYW